MKRILFISQYLNRGGTEAFMMSVYRGVDKSRFIVDFLLYSNQETDYSREVKADGNRVYQITCRKKSVIAWHRELNAFFKEHFGEYQVIHFCGNSLTSIAPIFYAYKYGVPIRIIHAHSASALGLHNKILHILKRKYAGSISTHHLACSIKASQWFFGNEKTDIIKNGIDTRLYSYNTTVRTEIRNRLGITEQDVVIGHVGNFRPEKNHSCILDIYSEYHGMNPASKLMLVGTGPLMEDARIKAKSLGMEDCVMFLGERTDVADLMQAMDLFLMPSTFEGLPFVLIEAQCAGLPCVISDVISRDVCITDNVVYRSLQENAGTWAQCIEQTLSNFTRQDTSGTIDKAGYSVKDTIKYLEKIYDCHS